jgi:hypothetical protein
MKRWGLWASSLSAVAKADAGQNTSHKQLNPNVLYMMRKVLKSFKYTNICNKTKLISVKYSQVRTPNVAKSGHRMLLFSDSLIICNFPFSKNKLIWEVKQKQT